MKLAGKTDIGCTRSENQDDYRAARLPEGDAWGVVCDGMGGANGGKLAASLASARFERALQGALARGEVADPQNFLQQTIADMNQTVHEQSLKGPEYRGMGTTAVCALVQRGVAHIVHVGDSRAYLRRGRRMIQLTKDHSMVQQLLESGQITPEEAEKHPRKNLSTRAVGVNESVQADYTCCPLAEGDILLLCSDGLSNLVSEEEMEQIITNTSFFDVPDRLVQLALRAGGQDNITVLLMGTEPGEV